MEADLPDFHFLIVRFADLIGAAAFDQLNGFFEACCRAWSEHEVQMVGHYDEFMKSISFRISIMKEGFD